MNNIISKLLFVLILTFTAQSIYAHTTSTSYLNLNLDNASINGSWQVTLKDMHLVLGLDLNSDSQLVWSEISSQKQTIISELKRSITISTKDGDCKLQINNIMIDRRQLTVYLNIPFDTNCISSAQFSVSYDFLFNQDAFHKAILTITNNKNTSTNILSYTNKTVEYNSADQTNFSFLIEFITQGIIHVLIGFDHVLFVLCLLLSATLLINYKNQNHNKLQRLLSNTFKLVTTFTIAHSITLILASTKIVSIPPTIIEPVIALSIIVLALLNLYSKKEIKHWPIVFFFGLIHGFGFAFVLEEIPNQSESLITTLFGFNLGVELGQIIIALLVFPILYFLYSKQFYHRYIIPISSVLIATVGLFWFIERTPFFV